MLQSGKIVLTYIGFDIKFYNFLSILKKKQDIGGDKTELEACICNIDNCNNHQVELEMLDTSNVNECKYSEDVNANVHPKEPNLNQSKNQ